MVDFAKLRKNSSIEKLTKALESQNQTRYARDERYWEPTVDKAGNGFAVIRFLDAPAVDGEEASAWVTMWNHSFKGPTGQWYIENCLTTLGHDDPVCQFNNKLWNSGSEDNKKRVSTQKRKLSYISNILVQNDVAHPENNGKVFLYRYGKKIMDKIKDKAGLSGGTTTAESAVTYRDPEDVIYNPFNFWEGGNFKLNIRNVDGYRNYDKSTFDNAPTALLGGDDAKIEALWRSEHSLTKEVDGSKFKGFDDLKSKLEKVLGLAGESGPVAARKSAEQVTVPASVPDEVPTAAQADAEIAAAVTPTATASDEDEFADFAKLASQS